MKKLLTILTGLTIISTPASNVVSCSSPPKDDSDYYIPKLSDQPKSIEKIIELAGNAEDKFQEYRELSTKEWNKYIKSIENWNDLTENERTEHNIFFSHNSIENQKKWIYSVWGITYNYKIYQFKNDYDKNFFSPNEHKFRLKASNLNEYNADIERMYLNNKYISNNTKEHIKKIQTWAIQENPNANK